MTRPDSPGTGSSSPLRQRTSFLFGLHVTASALKNATDPGPHLGQSTLSVFLECVRILLDEMPNLTGDRWPFVSVGFRVTSEPLGTVSLTRLPRTLPRRSDENTNNRLKLSWGCLLQSEWTNGGLPCGWRGLRRTGLSPSMGAQEHTRRSNGSSLQTDYINADRDQTVFGLYIDDHPPWYLFSTARDVDWTQSNLARLGMFSRRRRRSGAFTKLDVPFELNSTLPIARTSAPPPATR